MNVSEYRAFLCRIKDEGIPSIRSVFNQDVVSSVHLKRIELEELLKVAEQSGLTEPGHDKEVVEALYHVEENLPNLLAVYTEKLDNLIQDIDAVLADIALVDDKLSLADPNIYTVSPEMHDAVHASCSIGRRYDSLLVLLHNGDYPVLRILECAYAGLDQLLRLLDDPEASSDSRFWMQLYENIDFLKRQTVIPVG